MQNSRIPRTLNIACFSDFQPHLPMVTGHEMRIWYSEDLIDHQYESDNTGRTCADVYAN